MTAPLAAPVMSTTVLPVNQACASRNSCYGAGHQPVLLVALDVALRGQRLLAYGERRHMDGTRAKIQEMGHAPPPIRSRQPTSG